MNYQFTEQQLTTINEATSILWQSVRDGDFITNKDDALKYLTLKLCKHHYEVFGVLFLSSQHQPIHFELMFRGSLASCAVYPREIVKKALDVNAGALVLVHNHPSGVCTPSDADRRITKDIRNATSLFDISVLDHFILTPTDNYSFAQNMLI